MLNIPIPHLTRQRLSHALTNHCKSILISQRIYASIQDVTLSVKLLSEVGSLNTPLFNTQETVKWKTSKGKKRFWTFPVRHAASSSQIWIVYLEMWYERTRLCSHHNNNKKLTGENFYRWWTCVWSTPCLISQAYSYLQSDQFYINTSSFLHVNHILIKSFSKNIYCESLFLTFLL